MHCPAGVDLVSTQSPGFGAFSHLKLNSMFFSRWFFAKSHVSKPQLSKREKPSFSNLQKAAPNEAGHGRQTELKIQASREAVYEAIREVMTRSAILSASYKFKVLSLDRLGSSYLAMIDLSSITSDAVLRPAQMETQIIQRALTAHQITVSAVYWRLNETAAVNKVPPFPTHAETAMPGQAVNQKLPTRYPVQAEKVETFQNAMLDATAGGSPLPSVKKLSSRSGLRSSNHLRDFDDTEATPSVSYAALSTTQYGDL